MHFRHKCFQLTHKRTGTSSALIRESTRGRSVCMHPADTRQRPEIGPRMACSHLRNDHRTPLCPPVHTKPKQALPSTMTFVWSSVKRSSVSDRKGSWGRVLRRVACEVGFCGKTSPHRALWKLARGIIPQDVGAAVVVEVGYHGCVVSADGECGDGVAATRIEVPNCAQSTFELFCHRIPQDVVNSVSVEVSDKTSVLSNNLMGIGFEDHDVLVADRKPERVRLHPRGVQKMSVRSSPSKSPRRGT